MRVQEALTSRRRILLAVSATVVALDQITKQWAEAALADGPVEAIPVLLTFRFTENPGSAFSLFQNGGPFLGMAAMVAAVVIWFAVESAERPEEVVGLGLIMGGALGNLMDRIFRGDGLLDGKVIDFIEFPNFPNFNIADSAITIGAVLLLWAAIRHRD